MPKLQLSFASRLCAALLPPCRVTLPYARSGGGGGVAPLSRSLSTLSLPERRRFEKECSVPAARKSSVAPLKPAIPDVVVTQMGPSNDWFYSHPQAFCNYQYPNYDRLMPCPSGNMIPRIEHLVASKGGNVVDIISKSLNLPPLYVVDLIHFGAVFYALVCPKPPPTATPEELRVFKEVTDPAILKKRLPTGKTVRAAQKTFRVTDPNQMLEAGMYLRVHVHPKRFPRYETK